MNLFLMTLATEVNLQLFGSNIKLTVLGLERSLGLRHPCEESFITFQQLLRFQGRVGGAQAAGRVAQQVREGGGHRHSRGVSPPL